MRAVFAVALVGFIVTGCAGSLANPVARTAPYIEEEYAPYVGDGTATITGQAFLKTRGGDVKYGAGNTVVLNPVTAYSSEWFQKAVLEGKAMREPDPRTTAHTRTTTADGEGRFKFANIPSGEYYIACPISWQVGAYSSSGGVAYAHISVQEGETVDVVVTR